MDFVSGSATPNFGLLQDFYQTTLKAQEWEATAAWAYKAISLY